MARLPRRLFLALLAFGLVALLAVLVPSLIGPYFIRSRALPKIEERIGRKIQVGEIRVGLGSVELIDLIVDGAGAPAPVAVPRVVVRFSVLPLFVGRLAIGGVTLERPRFDIVRGDAGDDNISSILARLRATKEPSAAPSEGRRRTGPDELSVVAGSLLLADESLGEIEVAGIEVSARREGAGSATLSEVEARLSAGPSGEVKKITVSFAIKEGKLDGLPTISVAGGAIKVWKGFALSGIEGGVTPDPADPKRAAIELQGGYGGVDKVLWSAKGWAHPEERQGALKIVAARFDLGQLAPILVDTPIIDPAHAQVDAHLDLAFRGDATDPKHLHDAIDFDGNFHLAGLDVYAARLGPLPVRGLGFDATAKGRLEPKARALHLEKATLAYRGVQLSLDLDAWKLGRGRVKAVPPTAPLVDGAAPVVAAPVAAAPAPAAKPAGRGAPSINFPGMPATATAPPIGPQVPAFLPAFRLNLKVASVSCQTALAALPAEMTPALQGFKLQGKFTTEIHLAIDPDDLESIDLGSKIGIDGCNVVEAPLQFAADRLLDPFDQAVEVEPGSWMAFAVGPENPDWVPYEDISPHLVNSIMTTEDSTFMTHKGFIGREFKSALKSNLEHGYFRLGASSITMQMVKNVLLSREKTLSRKLQEMFLTWYLERNLTKERILEIYFNVIEFGPGIYGIGRAARHYFGKPAKQLLPREAAFFSSILPNPKKRYVQFCHGAPDLKWELYLNRIIRRMHERGRLTDDEFATALSSRLTFSRTQALPEAQCLEMVKRLIAAQMGQADPTGKPMIQLDRAGFTDEEVPDQDAPVDEDSPEP